MSSRILASGTSPGAGKANSALVSGSAVQVGGGANESLAISLTASSSIGSAWTSGPSASVYRVGLVVGGWVGESCDAEHEGVGDLDAAEASVVGDAVESGLEDAVGCPAVVLAGFVDRGD